MEWPEDLLWDGTGECAMCGKKDVKIKMIDGVGSVCADCLDAFFFRCARCGEFWLDDPDLGPGSIETESGEIICQYCADG